MALKVNPELAKNVTNGYAYAWLSGVYPLFDDYADWHKPYNECFEVSESMVDELGKFLDTLWSGKQTITFYKLEEKYRGSKWDRASLIKACRYMFLNGMFDGNNFWERVCENMECPVEAKSIVREFSLDEISFA